MGARCFMYFQFALNIQHTTNRSDTGDDPVHFGRKHWTAESDGAIIHSDSNCARMGGNAAQLGTDPLFQYDVVGMAGMQKSPTFSGYAARTIDQIASGYLSRIS